ncbi:MAG: uridine diphosphate-N-acetylglucosamine-binding protein YvcK [Chloroflexota bacterium]|nr:uridine diphosphate-N-acetylglucosamine-binding protein YvcK [Chloroflexota bacterium]
MTLPQWFRNLLTPGIGVKRWLILLFVGLLATAFGFALGILRLMRLRDMLINTALETGWLEIALITLVGGIAVMVGFLKLSRSLLAPYRRHMPTPVLDAVVSHSRRNKGMRVVAIGGGTGMPSVLRGLKAFTSNMTAVVTVADDGGSSGRLRREFGVLPPGDLRNNIAALADDESLMTQLFQYRFSKGDLGGHAFGNLFITALSGVTGSLETALVETERVLNIQGRVLPATLEEVTLTADILLLDSSQAITVRGESQISEAGGRIVHIGILPERVEAFAGSVRAILEAEIVTIGPGSLYTSILPNVLVGGIADALRATDAYKIYICNIATQPGETTGYSVADHVLALEQHIGRGVFQLILANSAFPSENAGITRYVQLAPPHHEILQRYEVRYADLVDDERPWRHDPHKLGLAIMEACQAERVYRVSTVRPVTVARNLNTV